MSLTKILWKALTSGLSCNDLIIRGSRADRPEASSRITVVTYVLELHAALLAELGDGGEGCVLGGEFGLLYRGLQYPSTRNGDRKLILQYPSILLLIAN